LVPLIKVKEGVGEVNDVLMAVDIGSKRSNGGIAEEYRQKTMETSKAKPQDYIFKTSLQSSSLSPMDLIQTPICPSNPSP